MQVYHILLGGNLGNVVANFEAAKRHLIQNGTSIVAQSNVYSTAAWGVKAQPDFLNQALAIETPLAPLDFLALCLKTEDALGRVRVERWGARTMDIDILLAADFVSDLPVLEVPHPRLHLRRFALLPLSDIAAAVVHPIYKETIAILLARCTDTSAVRLFSTVD